MHCIENKLKEMGFAIPDPAKPAGSYVPGLCAGNLLFISGQLPIREGTVAYTGKVGAEQSADAAVKAAELCALNCVGVIKAMIGDLDKVEQIVKVTGFVNSANGFSEQPAVINGASDFLKAVFGERGLHTRSAVGVAGLPFNAACEVEMIVKFKENGFAEKHVGR